MHETAYSKISEPNGNERSTDFNNEATGLMVVNQTSSGIGHSGHPIASYSNGFHYINAEDLK
jgi:hypothetical protein